MTPNEYNWREFERADDLRRLKLKAKYWTMAALTGIGVYPLIWWEFFR